MFSFKSVFWCLSHFPKWLLFHSNGSDHSSHVPDPEATSLREEAALNLLPRPLTTRPSNCSLESRAQAQNSNIVDLEKGLVPEHAVLRVSGLTCTDCERKLQRVLADMKGIHNMKTSLVLGRAEFDTAPGVLVCDVVSLLERKTEFKFAISSEGHQIDVFLSESVSLASSKFAVQATAQNQSMRLPLNPESAYPLGVQDITIVKVKGRTRVSQECSRGVVCDFIFNMFARKPRLLVARITYDPRVVGARNLMEIGFASPLTLAPPIENSDTDINNRELRRTFFKTLLSVALTVPVLVMAWARLSASKIALESSSLVLASLVQFVIAGPFYTNAWNALIYSRMIEMDLLIVISTSTAYIYSVVAFAFQMTSKPLASGSYFETSTLLVTLIMCGRLGSAYAREKAMKLVSLQSLQPSTAILVRVSTEEIIDVRCFQYGDLFKVLPDSVVPTDGIIMSGLTEVDESMINGESPLVQKSAGSRIVAGSINGPGSVVVRLTTLPPENTISVITRMVDETKLSKPKIQSTADCVASYFVPCLLCVSFAVFAIWLAIGFAVRHATPSDVIITAIDYSLAAAIVSCPCAIGLAVPMVVVIASGVAAKHGVILKSPKALERARKVTHVVFDKTGTLTEGTLIVVKEIHRHGNRATVNSITKLLASSSKHPVSQALARHLESFMEEDDVVLENISSTIGKGLHAIIDGEHIRGGSPSYVGAVRDRDVQHLISEGLTVFCLKHESTLLAIYGLRDALRKDALAVVSALQKRNIHVSIVSGDSSKAVEKVAIDLGIPLSCVKGQCMPEDKARYIISLSNASTTNTNSSDSRTILFCGDGTNDAVALAQADIGVHMAGGTDVAKNAADVVLMQPSLGGILALLDVSGAAMRRVYLNFAWSVVYNFFAVLLAAGAFVRVRISPAYAGLGELVSVLPVVVIALHLKRVKIGGSA